MKVKSESEVPQSCPTLSNPMDCSPPGSSAHRILQAKLLEWGAIAFSNWNFYHMLNKSLESKCHYVVLNLRRKHAVFYH